MSNREIARNLKEQGMGRGEKWVRDMRVDLAATIKVRIN
jgi:hypothetical protein